MACDLSLRHIRRRENDREVAPASVVGAVPPSLSGTSSFVTLAVGEHAANVAHRVLFDCPVYILEAGSGLLREWVTDWAERESGGGDDAVILLPFISEDVFETIALYLEHFYSVSGWLERPSSSSKDDVIDAGTLWSSQQRPSTLRTPLQFNDLYHLTEWESQFVLERLVKMPTLVEARQRKGLVAPISLQAAMTAMLENGKWVDALGEHSGERAAPTGTAASSDPREWHFTVDEKRVIMDELCCVLESATRLKIQPLQHLCAALCANLLVDRDEMELLSLLQRPDGPSISPFSKNANAKIHQKYPWLASSGNFVDDEAPELPIASVERNAAAADNVVPLAGDTGVNPVP